MSIEIVGMIAAVAWMHGRFYPATQELIVKQKERAFEKRVEKARQQWYGERFNRESVK